MHELGVAYIIYSFIILILFTACHRKKTDLSNNYIYINLCYTLILILDIIVPLKM